MRHSRSWTRSAAGLYCVLCAFAVVSVGAQSYAEDTAARELRRHQLLRQQQQDALQLRMQQHQRGAQWPPPEGLRQEQAIRQLEIEQQQRQRALQHRQDRNLLPPSPMEDEATGRAKAQIEQQRGAQESRRQLQRFDWELEQMRRRDGRS